MSGAASPPKPVGSILSASSCSGGVTPGVPGRAAASLQPLPPWSRGPHPWSLRPQFPLLVGTPLMGSGPPSDLDLLQGPYFQARSRPQVLSVRVPIYLCGGDTIQPVTDGETPGEQFGDRGQEPGVRRVWFGDSVTCLSGDAKDAKRYRAAQL